VSGRSGPEFTDLLFARVDTHVYSLILGMSGNNRGIVHEISLSSAPRLPLPLKRWFNESERVPLRILQIADARPDAGLLFQLAVARKTLFSHSPEARPGIVTCGGLCPGFNDVFSVAAFLKCITPPAYRRCSVPIGDINGGSGTRLRTSRSHTRDVG
jgi:hypothetical protein